MKIIDRTKDGAWICGNCGSWFFTENSTAKEDAENCCKEI